MKTFRLLIVVIIFIVSSSCNNEESEIKLYEDSINFSTFLTWNDNIREMDPEKVISRGILIHKKDCAEDMPTLKYMTWTHENDVIFSFYFYDFIKSDNDSLEVKPSPYDKKMMEMHPVISNALKLYLTNRDKPPQWNVHKNTYYQQGVLTFNLKQQMKHSFLQNSDTRLLHLLANHLCADAYQHAP